VWKQTTIETSRRARCIVAFSRNMQTGAILSAHPVRGTLHMRCRVNQAISTLPYLMSSRMSWLICKMV